MRTLNLCVFSLITAGLAAVVPAAADDQPVDVSATARMISMPSPNAAVPSDSNYNGLEEATVSVGLATPGVPCGRLCRWRGHSQHRAPVASFYCKAGPDPGYFDMVRIDHLYRALHCRSAAEARRQSGHFRIVSVSGWLCRRLSVWGLLYRSSAHGNGSNNGDGPGQRWDK